MNTSNEEVQKSLKNIHKHVQVTPEVAEYIDELLLESESEEMKLVLVESLSLEHAQMQILFSQGRYLETFVKAVDAKKVLEIGMVVSIVIV